MGAKQSKRSVDISGKEAESAGEVAAAGAGGEGRLEAIADSDTLKPQLNGDAQHIEAPQDKTDKEKELDSGTPENEKDATTEKEIKEQENGKEAGKPAVNGDSEQKPEQEENGESTPTPEQEGKKPKKEKVKKKWSLRSISFSRKDKPKQEKKQKDEEPKTNGEPEKVPEEAAEVSPESVEVKPVENATPDSETKEDKTPETPVTEPLTNGSSTPESPKVESPVIEAPVPEVQPPSERPEPVAVVPEPALVVPEPVAVAPEPEQLPVNGLSLEDKKEQETPEPIESTVENTIESTESVPAPEIPDKTEVCDKAPLIESTPPPLPANPPPPSVASFAASTLAPELSDLSLPNTTEADLISAPPVIPITEANDNVDSKAPNNEIIESNSELNVLTENKVTENDTEETIVAPTDNEQIAPVNNEPLDVVKNLDNEVPDSNLNDAIKPIVDEIVTEVLTSEPNTEVEAPTEVIPAQGPMGDSVHTKDSDLKTEKEDLETVITENGVQGTEMNNGDMNETEQENLKNLARDTLEVKQLAAELELPVAEVVKEAVQVVREVLKPADESVSELSSSSGTLPPPLPAADDGDEEGSGSLPPPPSDLCASDPAASPDSTQDALPVHDKIADMIPEVPELPKETATLQESASDVAVAN